LFLFLHLLCSFVWFGVFEKVFPPRSEEDRNDWALIRITRRGVTKWST